MNPHYISRGRKSGKAAAINFIPQPLSISLFNFSHKWPTFAFTPESGYTTLGSAQRIAHSGTHGETGGVSDTTNSVYANSKTAFVVVKTDAQGKVISKTAYTGINNAPTITAKSNSVNDGVDISYYCRNGNIATVMFIAVDTTKYNVTSGNQDILFFSPESASKKTEDKDDIYYTYNAVVDGKITEVKVAADVTINGTTGNGYFSYKNNSKLVYP